MASAETWGQNYNAYAGGGGMLGSAIGSIWGPAGSMIGGGIGTGIGGLIAGKPPNAAKDYRNWAEKAIQQQAKNQVVSEYGPLGSTVWSQGPGDSWQKTTTLSPEEQAKYTQSSFLENALLQGGNYLLPYIEQALMQGGQLDQSRLTSDPLAGQNYTDALMRMMEPQLQRNREGMYTNLANRGLGMNTQAFQNAMYDLGSQENQLYTNAAIQGAQTALQSRQQGISEQYAAQDRPLQQLGYLLQTAPVNMPDKNTQNLNVGAPDYLGATALGNQMNQYNQSQKASGMSSMGGMFGQGMGMMGGGK